MELRTFLHEGEGGAISDDALETLSAAEKARIIYHSRHATLADKHRALREIIDTLPDETVRCTDFTTKLPFEQSLHQLLRDYMAEQKRLEAAFFASESEVVYLVDLSQPVTGDSWSSGEPSLSWEACVRKLTDYMEWHESTGPWEASVTKYYPNVWLNGFMQELTAEFNASGELLDITSRMQIPLPKLRDLSWHMEHLPIAYGVYAPGPFRKGDIVTTTPAAQKKYPNLPQGPMLVMEEPNPAAETVILFCFDLDRQHPEIRSLRPSILRPYAGETQSSSCLVLKEVASALERGDSLQELSHRLGAALTYPLSRFFDGQE